MSDESYPNMCIFHTLDGLREGLSHFSEPSRVALIYAVRPDDPIRVYDPQNLLKGHEPILKELYLDSNQWCKTPSDFEMVRRFGQIQVVKNLDLAGLISCGGRSYSIFYQMWFTEHHPDICSTGPTERWLEHAAWLLSHDFSSDNKFCTGTSGYVLREYATHAVRDYIVDELNLMMGLDTQLRVYPILDAILGISKTREEGAWPRGSLLFAESRSLDTINFMARFPALEQPALENFKHVRKLLQAVENSERRLISDGQNIVGIAGGDMPKYCITADFLGQHGFLSLNGDLICSFADGSFHTKTFLAKLVQLEEALLESRLDSDAMHQMFRIITNIVHKAESAKYGCTLVIDLNEQPIYISGQHLNEPLNLADEKMLEMATDLAKVDGALHIGADRQLHGFACLLDGRALAGEDRARGARFNSALRFTAVNPNLIVIVVSADKPVSVIQEGVELNAQCILRPVSWLMATPPTLQEWLDSARF
jgi:hypothetical protein